MTREAVKIPVLTNDNMETVVRAIRELVEVREGLRGNEEERYLRATDFKASWMFPPMLDGWTRYNETNAAPAFMKDAAGIVRLRGTVAGGTVGGTGRILQLPHGSRPKVRLNFMVITNSGVGHVAIDPNGDVLPITGGNTWFSLDGVSFVSDQ